MTAVPELTITPCVHIELGGPGPDSMKLAPRSELIGEFMDWCLDEGVYPLRGTSAGHAGHHVAVFDAADYPRIRAWLADHGFNTRPGDGPPAELPFPPCPVCDTPVVKLEPMIRAGREVPLAPGVVMYENDRLVGHLLEPCGHTIKGWQWETVDGTPVVTYGEVVEL